MCAWRSLGWRVVFAVFIFWTRVNAQILDPSFDPGLGPDGAIRTVTISPDQKILIGGEFRTFNGSARTALVRLNTNGTVDVSFNAQISSTNLPLPASVGSIVVTASGQIYIGGLFNYVAGVPRQSLVRLNPDGTLDAAFAPDLSSLNPYGYMPGITAMALQADQKLIIGGPNQLARFNPDGSRDPSFSPGRPFNFFGILSMIRGIALQSDAILVGGVFTSWSGMPNAGFAIRLGFDGSPDPNFVVPLTSSSTPFGLLSFINQILPIRDHRMLLHGGFATMPNGDSVGTVVRVDGTGKSDPAFVSPPLTNPYAGYSAIVLCPDGKILAGATNLIRLNEDGTIDSGFATNVIADAAIRVLALDAAQNVLLGGDFSKVAGVTRLKLARIKMDLAAGPPSILEQPTNQTVKIGQTVFLHAVVEASALTPTFQWQRNGTNIPGADGSSMVISRTPRSSEGMYQLIISNPVGVVTSAVAQLNIKPVRVSPGAPNPELLSGALPGSSITSFTFDSRGGVLVTGSNIVSQINPAQVAFFLLDGSPRTSPFYYFGPYIRGPVGMIPSGQARCSAPLRDGSILVGGTFFARISPDGQLDQNFARGGTDGTLMGDSVDVRTIFVQDDGRIVLGGRFSKYGTAAVTNIARLLPSGDFDKTFQPPPAPPINTIIQDRNGMLVFGGSVGRKLFRLDSHGTIDSAFSPDFIFGPVNSIAEQPNGFLVVGGKFEIDDIRTNLVRLTALGQLDASFDAGALDGAVNAMIIQPDGKIMVAGEFTHVQNRSRNRVARLNPNGTLDETFDPVAGADGPIHAIAVSLDGELWVAGNFNFYDDVFSPSLARIRNDPKQFGSVIAEKQFRTSFRTVAGRTYFWERRSDWSGSWQSIQTIAGDGSIQSVVDVTTNSPGFYRVRITP